MFNKSIDILSSTANHQGPLELKEVLVNRTASGISKIKQDQSMKRNWKKDDFRLDSDTN